ncbi:hypothetical protein AHAS_Ahas10G0041900 [Arachis hypogaea]
MISFFFSLVGWLYDHNNGEDLTFTCQWFRLLMRFKSWKYPLFVRIRLSTFSLFRLYEVEVSCTWLPSFSLGLKVNMLPNVG